MKQKIAILWLLVVFVSWLAYVFVPKAVDKMFHGRTSRSTNFPSEVHADLEILEGRAQK